MLLGAHMSIDGGVDQAPVRGGRLGCQAIQLFLKNNTQWRSRPYRPEEIKDFFINKQQNQIKLAFAHSCYLINLASPDPVINQKSRLALLDEIRRAEKLRIPYIVIHPGSHKGSGEKTGLKAIAAGLNWVLQETPNSAVKIVLESTAGQGNSLGYKFEHLAEIMELVNAKERTGVCLDTCHMFAAGYDITTKQIYEATINEFDKIIGLERILAWHLNDSRYPLGSRRDRHHHIGQGLIGLEAFRLILNDDRFDSLPMVLETPKGLDDSWDEMNLNTLRSLIENK